MYSSSPSKSYYQTAYNQNGYGGMAYYTSAVYCEPLKEIICLFIQGVNMNMIYQM